MSNMPKKTVYNLGYTGHLSKKNHGKSYYKPTVNGKETHEYRVWTSMMKNAKDKKIQVYEKWYNFQNFAKWSEDNIYYVNDESMYLFNNLIIKNSNIYSPETCVFLPQRIFKLLINNNKKRGKYPVGIRKTDKCNTFQYRLCMYDKRVTKTGFKSEFDAFEAYKIAKEEYIKDVIKPYKDLIPNDIYTLLQNYKVEIND